MKFKAIFVPVLLATATIAAPAMANGTIILPNDVTVPYFGSGEPEFFVRGGNSGGGWEVRDTDTGNLYYYSQTGEWLGVKGPSASSVPGAPAVPTSITSPLTGNVIPFQLSGVPIITVRGTNAYEVVDIVSGLGFLYDGTDSLLEFVPLQGAGPLTGSSSFGGTSSGATSTTSGGSSSFGGTSGGTSSGASTTGGSTSGGTSSGATSTGGTTSSGGGTDVPAPAMFGLFGIAAGGLALARRRRRKGA